MRTETINSDELRAPPAVPRNEQHLALGSGGRRSPADTLSSRWSGYYAAKDSGQYEIFVASSGEDGGLFRLYLDDKLVFDNWTTSRALVSQTALTLGAGPHKVLLEQHGKSYWLGGRMQLGIL